jgi:hypothetical protein
MQPVDREGTFQAEIESFGLKEMESGSIAISIRANLTACWSGEGWDSWSEYMMDAQGDLWIVKKDGTLNSPQVEALMKHAGWDGNLESIINETWKPTPCQVVVQKDSYKGVDRYKIGFINDLNRTPGAMSNVDAAKAKELQARYGAQLRALAGNAVRNNAAPAGKPSAPPPAPAPRKIMGPPAKPQEEQIPL